MNNTLCLFMLCLANLSFAKESLPNGNSYDGAEVQCMGRKCLNSDECCPRTACVDPNAVDGDTHLEGVCVPLFPASGRELCDGDNCLIGADGSGSKLKQLNEECFSSSECDTSRGLCCQFMRSHRMPIARHVCSYYVDPKRCVGSLDQKVTDDMLSPKLSSLFKALMG